MQIIAAADGLILASPINYSSLTALFKKFQERCLALSVLKPLTGIMRRLAGVPFQAFGAAWGGRITNFIWAGGSMDNSYILSDRLLANARAAGARLAAAGY